MKERWVLLRKGADFAGIGERFHISPRLACLIRNRDIIGDENIESYLSGTIADLEDGMLMRDMDRAVEILMEKVREGASIRIIGDYDIDGVCATYILLEGLKGLGAVVDTDIPDRIADGYGLSRHLIDRAFEDALSKMRAMDEERARAYVKRLLLESAQGGEEIVVSPADGKLYSQAFLAEVNAELEKRGASGALTLSGEKRPMAGGFVLKRQGVEINCSYEAILRESRASLEAQVASMLFR